MHVEIDENSHVDRELGCELGKMDDHFQVYQGGAGRSKMIPVKERIEVLAARITLHRRAPMCHRGLIGDSSGSPR